MAKLKPLAAAVNPGMQTINNSGTEKLSKMVPVASIHVSSVFQELMPVNAKELAAITADMEAHGFDNSQPVHIWKEKNILIDGHTRLEAAKQVGLFDIPVYEHSFGYEKDALEYALKLQINRRNLDDAGMVTAIEKLDSLKRTGRPTADDTSEKGRSSEQLAELLGTNSRKVERVRSILKDGDEATVAAVKTGELSVNKAYNKIHPAKSPALPLPEPVPSKGIPVSGNEDETPGNEAFDIGPVESIGKDIPVTETADLPGRPSYFEQLLTASLDGLAEMLHAMQTSSSTIHIDDNPDILTKEEWKAVLKAEHK
jgi:hypothetical protein